jgi:hypothetical protein
MRQDGVGANAQVSEEGTHVTGCQPRAPKLEHAHGETVERSLFRAHSIVNLNNFVHTGVFAERRRVVDVITLKRGATDLKPLSDLLSAALRRSLEADGRDHPVMITFVNQDDSRDIPVPTVGQRIDTLRPPI